MREDMFKVIVERPRQRGWAWQRRKSNSGRDFDPPVKIGVRRCVSGRGIRSKYPSDHLKPLKRYFGSKVGQRWNDVYSDIAAANDPDNVVKAHVRQHIDNFVARHVGISRDGAWFVPTRHCMAAVRGGTRRTTSIHLTGC